MAKGKAPYGKHIASGRARCCVYLCTMISISLSGDECSFTRCVYVHYMCEKYLQDMLVSLQSQVLKR